MHECTYTMHVYIRIRKKKLFGHKLLCICFWKSRNWYWIQKMGKFTTEIQFIRKNFKRFCNKKQRKKTNLLSIRNKVLSSISSHEYIGYIYICMKCVCFACSSLRKCSFCLLYAGKKKQTACTKERNMIEKGKPTLERNCRRCQQIFKFHIEMEQRNTLRQWRALILNYNDVLSWIITCKMCTQHYHLPRLPHSNTHKPLKHLAVN